VKERKKQRNKERNKERKKQRNKETKKQRNKETKKQRNKETKKKKLKNSFPNNILIQRNAPSKSLKDKYKKGRKERKGIFSFFLKFCY
jgi:hypothetical protein